MNEATISICKLWPRGVVQTACRGKQSCTCSCGARSNAGTWGALPGAWGAPLVTAMAITKVVRGAVRGTAQSDVVCMGSLHRQRHPTGATTCAMKCFASPCIGVGAGPSGTSWAACAKSLDEHRQKAAAARRARVPGAHSPSPFLRGQSHRRAAVR